MMFHFLALVCTYMFGVGVVPSLHSIAVVLPREHTPLPFHTGQAAARFMLRIDVPSRLMTSLANLLRQDAEAPVKLPITQV
jgi:hypothetical protein